MPNVSMPRFKSLAKASVTVYAHRLTMGEIGAFLVVLDMLPSQGVLTSLHVRRAFGVMSAFGVFRSYGALYGTPNDYLAGALGVEVQKVWIKENTLLGWLSRIERAALAG